MPSLLDRLRAAVNLSDNAPAQAQPTAQVVNTTEGMVKLVRSTKTREVAIGRFVNETYRSLLQANKDTMGITRSVSELSILVDGVSTSLDATVTGLETVIVIQESSTSNA